MFMTYVKIKTKDGVIFTAPLQTVTDFERAITFLTNEKVAYESKNNPSESKIRKDKI